jgi:hypothetical protein
MLRPKIFTSLECKKDMCMYLQPYLIYFYFYDKCHDVCDQVPVKFNANSDVFYKKTSFL